MPVTRSTTKHRRETQNSRRDAIRQGRRGFSRCERCGGLFSLYRGSETRHENACRQREEQRKLREAQIQAERQTPTPQPYTPMASSPEIESEMEAGLEIMGVAAADGGAFLSMLSYPHYI